MLELSAAQRAVAREPLLRPAIAVLQREHALARAREATGIVLDRTRGTVWTRDGSVISDEVHGARHPGRRQRAARGVRARAVEPTRRAGRVRRARGAARVYERFAATISR